MRLVEAFDGGDERVGTASSDLVVRPVQGEDHDDGSEQETHAGEPAPLLVANLRERVDDDQGSVRFVSTVTFRGSPDAPPRARRLVPGFAWNRVWAEASRHR